jgi:hypothetical protein
MCWDWLALSPVILVVLDRQRIIERLLAHVHLDVGGVEV